VPVRTCESLRKALLLNGARPGLFSVASNPEFLREGTAVTDFIYPDRIVFGADDATSASWVQFIVRLRMGAIIDKKAQSHPRAMHMLKPLSSLPTLIAPSSSSTHPMRF